MSASVPLPEPGYRLKLRRAAQHLELIDLEAQTFVDNLRSNTNFSPRPSNRWTVITRGEVKPVDPMWGTYLGDFVHNARSALDNLVCAMIRENNPDHPIGHAFFPAFEGVKAWTQEIVEWDRDRNRRPAPTDGVSAEVLAAIERSQPYHITPKSKRKRAGLLLLQSASNTDKHRTIHATSVRIAPRTTHPGQVWIEPTGYFDVLDYKLPAPGTLVETGSEICRLKAREIIPAPSDVLIAVRVQAPLEITFSVEGRKDLSHIEVWPIMNEVWRAVLRVEKAAGIENLPPPLPGWTWTPDQEA